MDIKTNNMEDWEKDFDEKFVTKHKEGSWREQGGEIGWVVDYAGVDVVSIKQFIKEQIDLAEERGAERFAKHLIPVVEDEHDLNLARYVSESLKNFKKSDYGKEK